jgi:rubredoxin
MRFITLALLSTIGDAFILTPSASPFAQRRIYQHASKICACESPSTQQRRMALPTTDLLSARTATEKKKKKGIRSITIGNNKIDFAHDMTNTFIYGGIILGMGIYKVARFGKGAFADEPNYKHIARNEAEETELHEFCCENCGYTMFPARGREGKFFPDDFKCPSCEAPKEAFFDMTDLSDPRTVEALENDEDFEYEIQEVVVPIDDSSPAPSSPAPAPDLKKKQNMPPQPPRAAPPSPPAPRAASPPASPPPRAQPPKSPPSQSTEGDDGFDPLNNPLL